MISTGPHKQLTTIFIFSLILAVSLFFLDESRYSFDFLLNPSEWGMLLVFALIFSGIPFAIYGFLRQRNHRRPLTWALIGFFPPLAILCWLSFA